MSGAAPPRTAVRRLPDKARHDVAGLHGVLDAGRVAHVAVVDGGQPYALPMAYGRDGDELVLHGSSGSRLCRLLAEGAAACATVTTVDGLVLARSAFETSMHYRCAMVLGSCRVLSGDAAVRGLEVVSEHVLPGRWADVRPPSRKELAATLVLAMPLVEWSVKVSDGPPEDDDGDLALPVWAGVLPLREASGPPLPAPDLRPGTPLPEYLR